MQLEDKKEGCGKEPEAPRTTNALPVVKWTENLQGPPALSNWSPHHPFVACVIQPVVPVPVTGAHARAWATLLVSACCPVEFGNPVCSKSGMQSLETAFAPRVANLCSASMLGKRQAMSC
jgi:hypothetical protein